MSRPDRLDAVLRTNFAAFARKCFHTVSPGVQFVPGWAYRAMAHALTRCLRGEVRRQIITVCPRSGKSNLVSVALVAFWLGHNPTLRILCVSYSQDLAFKLARDCRRVMESAWYRRLFPKTVIDPRKNAEGEFETAAGGGRFATSPGGTLTGRGADLIVLDDPIKPTDAQSEAKRRSLIEWFDSTVPSRLDQKTRGVIVLVTQRVHHQDLVGHVLSKGEPWEHLSLPAIAEVDAEIPIGPEWVHHRKVGDLLQPEREPQHVLDELKVAMGSAAFAAQYQQNPVPREGAVVKYDWLRWYKEAPVRQPGDQIVQSWDCASQVGTNNDFSVCTIWLVRGGDYYLLDVFRRRLAFPDLRRAVIAQAERFHPVTILIENASAGQSLIQDLRATTRLGPLAIKSEGDKVQRLHGVTARIEAGQVHLPEEAPWLADFLNEVMAFPQGRHDDQVDSLSQFVHWISTRPQPELVGLFGGWIVEYDD